MQNLSHLGVSAVEMTTDSSRTIEYVNENGEICKVARPVLLVRFGENVYRMGLAMEIKQEWIEDAQTGLMKSRIFAECISTQDDIMKAIQSLVLRYGNPDGQRH